MTGCSIESLLTWINKDMEIEERTFDAHGWNSLAAPLRGAHILQTWEWVQFKSQYGWKPLPQIWRDTLGRVVAAALVHLRTVQLRGRSAHLCILYVPKGPMLDWSDVPLRRRVMGDLASLARQQGAIFIKIDPDVRRGMGVPGSPTSYEEGLGQEVLEDLTASGWRFSQEQVQFRNTVVLDLAPDLDSLLANMKQKTRYNIRLAERKGVRVRRGDLNDLAGLYQMYAETAIRDDFVVREKDYYLTLWSSFMQAGLAEPLIAEVEGEIVAGMMLFRFAEKAWFLYGMSSQSQREKMPSYLIQWHAIQQAKTSGCREYDLWGAPDEFSEGDRLWGVYRFKEGFGGQVVRHIGAWDLPVRPFWYKLYTQLLPRLLDLMRSKSKWQTRRMLAG